MPRTRCTYETTRARTSTRERKITYAYEKYEGAHYGSSVRSKGSSRETQEPGRRTDDNQTRPSPDAGVTGEMDRKTRGARRTNREPTHERTTNRGTDFRYGQWTDDSHDDHALTRGTESDGIPWNAEERFQIPTESQVERGRN